MESDALRIGAEQEMFLIDSSFHPAPLALEIIEAAQDKRLTTEKNTKRADLIYNGRC